jgi:hypothetical protein
MIMSTNINIIIYALIYVQKKQIYRIIINIYVKENVQKIIHLKMKIMNALMNEMLQIYLIIYVE